ncbi:MAG: hypothetical protein IPK26_05845 [Planctomycetes bacterium]|nr:hypothetical protein [Planctomycetota bacterium]
MVLGDRELLAVWEHAAGHEPATRATLLAAIASGLSEPAARMLPLGQRDRHLLTLHRDLFGDRLEGETSCRDCGERMEFAADATSLLARTGSEVGVPADGGDGDDARYRLLVDGVEVRFRLPDGDDLAAAAAAPDVAAARTCLLQRLVLTATRGGLPLAAQALPESVQRQLAERIEALEPLTTLELQVRCPCHAELDAHLDIAAFLWEALQRRAARLLDEVDLLARTYGWSESDILQIGPRRRREYLARIAP